MFSPGYLDPCGYPYLNVQQLRMSTIKYLPGSEKVLLFFEQNKGTKESFNVVMIISDPSKWIQHEIIILL